MRYLHQDHLGSTSVITDDTDRLYTGQRFDSATGLYYYNARYYDPTLARFISPDTIVPRASDPQAWNRYACVGGNPLRYTDPSGHCLADTESGGVEKTSDSYFDCTADQFAGMQWRTRKAWLYLLEYHADTKSWFNSMRGIIGYFETDQMWNNLDGWASMADAGVL